MLDEVIQLDKKYYLNTFGDRLPVCFEKGDGMKLFDDKGNTYYDFLGGIAVNALGHGHKDFINALKNQLDKVVHTSSLYYIENQAKLAQKLVENTCAEKAFFANSGAEANEGAFKLAKIYYYKKGLDKYEIITLDKSFHGRTLATVAATGQEKYQKPYRPLTPGFKQVEPNNFKAIEDAVTDKTAAIMIELIQGESGVHPMDKEYVEKLRKLCDEKDIILIFDEVQTGMGRTGYLFAHQMYGVEPDIFTSAKALGGGIPIGAVCAGKRLRLHLNRVTTEQHSAVIRSQRRQGWLCLIFLKRNILLKMQVRWVSILKKNLQNFKINIRIKLQMSEMQVF